MKNKENVIFSSDSLIITIVLLKIVVMTNQL